MVHFQGFALKFHQKGRTSEEKDTVLAAETEPQDKAIPVPLKQLDIGFATKQALRKKKICLLPCCDLSENHGEKSSYVPGSVAH